MRSLSELQVRPPESLHTFCSDERDWLIGRIVELERDLADAQEESAQLRASDRVTYADYESANQTATNERRRADLTERALVAANTLDRQDREHIERLEQKHVQLRAALAAVYDDWAGRYIIKSCSVGPDCHACTRLKAVDAQVQAALALH